MSFGVRRYACGPGARYRDEDEVRYRVLRRCERREVTALLDQGQGVRKAVCEAEGVGSDDGYRRVVGGRGARDRGPLDAEERIAQL
ncbi:hypothetical protein, partial [Streptomyces noursei]|uniref:hypothetical protein n=1 Tax=Streptomyces noursei TaxID=1971 RepID=UPI0033EF5074